MKQTSATAVASVSHAGGAFSFVHDVNLAVSDRPADCYRLYSAITEPIFRLYCITTIAIYAYATNSGRLLCQALGLLKRAIRMARNDDHQSLAASKGCSINRSGRQRCIPGRWRMITQHRRLAGVAHE